MSQNFGLRLDQAASFSVRRRSVDNFEELTRIVKTAHTEVTQVDRGRLHGQLAHFQIGDLPLDLGSFSLGVRSRGVVSEDRITIGMLTGRTGRVTHWSYEMQPGDVVVWSPRTEHDARYYRGASVAVISLASSDLASIFDSERELREPGAWIRNHYRSAVGVGAATVRLLQTMINRLETSGASLSADAAEFWKRAIVEAMTTAILENSPSEMDGPLPSALRIVNKVEDYIEATAMRPVHISQICSELHVSRRTLHRAFHDSLGLGPATFLRRKRLCSVHKNLRSGNPTMTTVAEIAFQHGFANLGRFSGEYHSLFDEYPSETLAAR